MVSEVLSILFLGIIPLLVAVRADKTLTIFAVASLCYEYLYVNILDGFRIPLVVYIGFWVCLKYIPLLFKNVFIGRAPLLIEFVWCTSIGVFFLFFPWPDDGAYLRTWTQSQVGKTIIGPFRIAEPITVIYFFAIVIYKKHLTFEKLLIVLSWVCIINFGVGFIDSFTNGIIKSVFHFTDREVLGSRFTGLSTEPKYYGKVCAFSLIILLAGRRHLGMTSSLILKLGVFTSFLGLLASFSLSALGVAVLPMLYYLFYAESNLKLIPLYIGVILVSLVVILQNETFIEITSLRIAQLLLENPGLEIEGTPVLFSSLEVFDAVAAAFFYHNPVHLIWGVGPNTIAIAATNYMSPYAKLILGEAIHSPPNIFLLYYLSRGGIISIICYGVFFYRLKKIAKKCGEWLFYGLVMILLYFMLVSGTSYLFFFYAGILIGIFALQKQTRIG